MRCCSVEVLRQGLFLSLPRKGGINGKAVLRQDSHGRLKWGKGYNMKQLP